MNALTLNADPGVMRAIEQHLDSAGIEYLNSINGTDTESFNRVFNYLKPILIHCASIQTVACIGIGQGEELHAVHDLTRGKAGTVYGLDISQSAIDSSIERSVCYNIPVQLIHGSATLLPFNEQTIDVFVCSAIMHEVYSYFPNGLLAWSQVLQRIALALNDGGILLLRDPEASSCTCCLTLGFKSNVAAAFYDYFRDEYRKFRSWRPDAAATFRSLDAGNKLCLPDRLGQDSVRLDISTVAELVLHFRNFYHDCQRGLVRMGNPNWKEINESYFLPICQGSYQHMDITQYVSQVIRYSNEALTGTNYTFKCVDQRSDPRPETVEMLRTHFEVVDDDGRISPVLTENVLKDVTKKMELIFQKSQKQYEIEW